MMAFLVRHARWVFAAALVLVPVAAAFGAVSLTAASAIAAGIVIVLVVVLMVAGIVTERVMRTDGGADDAYFGAVTGGQPLSRTALRDTRRDLVLNSRRAEAHAKVSAIARHYRRHGGAR